MLETFPELSRPALSALRDAAPMELLLRFVTCVSIHMRMAPHPQGADSAPRDFMGPQKGETSKKQDGNDENAKDPGADSAKQGAEHVGTDTVKDGGVLEGFKGMIDAQCAPVGDAAEESDLDVRFPLGQGAPSASFGTSVALRSFHAGHPVPVSSKYVHCSGR